MPICDHCKKEFAVAPKPVRHRLYHTLHGIKQRCYNPKNKDYKNYGGRGITVCDEWLSNPSAFVQWGIENGWQKGLHTDRKDNDGNYTPNNCQFITNAANQLNKRSRYSKRDYVYLGIAYTLSGLAKKVNIPRNVIWSRVVINNWDIAIACETPIRTMKKRMEWGRRE